MRGGTDDVNRLVEMAKSRGGTVREAKAITEQSSPEKRAQEEVVARPIEQTRSDAKTGQENLRILELPYPPTVNTYWRIFRNRKIISVKGRKYRQTIKDLLTLEERIEGRLQVNILVHPPDKRKRDLDNILKSLLDAMQEGGLYEDDSQIDDLRVIRGVRKTKGSVVVTVRELQSTYFGE